MFESGKYGSLLKREGLKNTKHRNSIMEVIEKSTQPVSAEQIFLELKGKKTSINLSSVYRNLDSLVSKGLVVKSSISGDNKGLFELPPSEHKHHLICSCCKRMFYIDGCPLEQYEKQVRDKTGFDITGHKLEIYGLCGECKSRKS
jgi:Fur family ferric uptake transcriptional regulator